MIYRRRAGFPYMRKAFWWGAGVTIVVGLALTVALTSRAQDHDHAASQEHAVEHRAAEARRTQEVAGRTRRRSTHDRPVRICAPN